MFLAYKNKNNRPSVFFLIEYYFAALYLSNALYNIHFGWKMAILKHLLERVPDRPNFTILTYFHCVSMAHRKDMHQLLIFYFKEHAWGSLKLYSQ